MPGVPAPQQQIFTIEQLVALNPYNPDILPDLESYVDEQVRSERYS
jgi:translation initiation factor 3 subunit K